MAGRLPVVRLAAVCTLTALAALAPYSADEGGGGELGEVDLTVPVCSVPVQDEGFRYLLVGGFDHILFLSLREVFSGDPGGSCSVGVENADDVACADVFLVSDVEIHGFFSFRVGCGLYMGFLEACPFGCLLTLPFRNPPGGAGGWSPADLALQEPGGGLAFLVACLPCL